ncbi:MAG: helix-turn-helix domain-containing protein [Acidimicrobiales bacterium]
MHPAGSVGVADGVDLFENEHGGVVALWGMLSWCWDANDLPARRLAMVGLVATGAASRVEVAAGFGVSTESARRWSRAYESGGAEALGVGRMGPKRPSKLTEEKRSGGGPPRARGVPRLDGNLGASPLAGGRGHTRPSGVLRPG